MSTTFTLMCILSPTVQAFLAGIPSPNKLVLDIAAAGETALWLVTNGFFGSSFIWGFSDVSSSRSSFGGNLTMVRVFLCSYCVLTVTKPCLRWTRPGPAWS